MKTLDQQLQRRIETAIEDYLAAGRQAVASAMGRSCGQI